MKVYISVVSHGHASLIRELGCLSILAKSYTVVVKSNKIGDDFSFLSDESGFYWIDKDYLNGFGTNNNIIFNFCMNELGMSKDDLFLVLNPDVIILKSQIDKLISFFSMSEIKLASINLYKDHEHSLVDNSIRRFPTFKSFLFSFLGLGNNTIVDKSRIANPVPVDWAAGSFLAFRVSHYLFLRGFDQRYFMYCEDIDICFRSSLAGESIVFCPDITAVHLAKHANRNLFSRHFFWHVSSSLRFLISKKISFQVKSMV